MDLEIPIEEKTELGEVFENLDRDILDQNTKMTTIDFNTRLSRDEIKASMIIDELTRLGILPKDTGITRQIKRLNVSLEGRGREEKVRIVTGEREGRGFGGMMDKFGSMFRRRE